MTGTTARAQATSVVEERERRMKWWKDARFGMFIHWGLYSQLERGEWVMHLEQTPMREYEALARTWKPKPRAAREWARLARDAGMKYMVMTAKHHDGFCLWDTKMTGYNAVRRGPGRDLVREYTDACREFGLGVGLYYSLWDWHHPDCARSVDDGAARKRFVEFTHGCVRELCGNYGKIDILWYDGASPLRRPEEWQSARMNAMARELQPDIIINNRSCLPEDFGTPEESVTPEQDGRAWESCMTMNGAWGYFPTALDWLTVRQIVWNLRKCAVAGGNYLLNVGPRADGSIPKEAYDRLIPVGKWLKKNGEAVYGKANDILGHLHWMATGDWTMKGKTAYYWCSRWAGKDLNIGFLRSKVVRASFLATGKPIRFRQEKNRLVLIGLPRRSPDPIAQTCVIKLECARKWN